MFSPSVRHVALSTLKTNSTIKKYVKQHKGTLLASTLYVKLQPATVVTATGVMLPV